MVDPSAQKQFVCALEAGDFNRLRELLSAGADVNLPIGNPGAETPLIRAISHGNLNLVKLLIELGADVNLAWKGPRSCTPLMFARDKPDIIRELAAAGADLNARTSPETIKSPHGGFKLLPGGETALHLAAAAGNVDDVKALLEAGADPEACANNGLGPLDYALQFGSITPASEALVEAGAELTPKRLELMHSAAHRPDSDVLEFPFLRAPGSEGNADSATGPPKEPSHAGSSVISEKGFRCPQCHALIYSRKPKLCGQCGAILPANLLLTDEQAYAQSEGRRWARDLADKFGSPGASTVSPATATVQPPNSEELTPQSLLRPLSFAAEFNHRDRPIFWVCLAGEAFTFFLIAFFWAKLGLNSVTTWLIALACFAFIVRVTWMNASPLCPNCKQNVRICTPQFCHVCGRGLKFGRCSNCQVDHAHRKLFLPYPNQGNYLYITYCPGCGAHLDSRVSRWRRRYR